ncbi:hypothetical protein ABIC22_004797 [Paenibacillus sp. PvP094]|uniref:Uncharacterized protein n=1 Tax=Paenibacillus illinoisensis TaxID=59845 RepID=A0A2W0C6J0_9BACL|nr:ABC-three component system middle component 6 [Paenibacillus illinoisensis]PYY27524.1 Uncharacterized protein PIL02S_04117 [Paenibacillus illinoisensis]
MLLPNEIKPENSVYYFASLVLKEVQRKEKLQIVLLFQFLKDKYGISLKIFAYCLDWLYLIEAIKIDEKGDVELCT